jgi:hypothetical protein
VAVRAFSSPMIKSLFPVVALLILLGLPARADSTTGPLVVTPPSSDWSVQYKKDTNGEVYTLVCPPGQNILLTFSRWPAPGDADQIPGFLETMAKKFAELAQRNPKIKLESTAYTSGEFIGYPFSGKYVEFTIKGGLKQVLFMFSEGNGIWNGQYIGPADGWLDAMEVLKGIKKS